MSGLNTYAPVDNATRGYFDRQLLEHQGPVIVLQDFCDKKMMRRNETNLIQWRRTRAFKNATVPLTEGVNPSGQSLVYDTISAILEEFGDWSGVTTKILHFSKDEVLPDIAQRQGEQIASTREELLDGVARAGTSVTYAGGKTARSQLDKDATFTVGAQNRGRAKLYRNKATKFKRSVAPSRNYETFPIPASYACVIHTDAVPTIEELGGTKAPQTDHFHSVVTYGTGSPISIHEVGAFRDIRYVASPDLGKFEGAGAEAAAGSDQTDYYNSTSRADPSKKAFDVYYALYIGRHALGAVAVEGIGDVESVLVQPTPQVGDPLGRTGWVGWKTWLAYVILNDMWMDRAEFVLKIEG